MKKQLLVIATLDTKGREAAYVRDSAAERGVHPVLMDIGVLGVPQTRPDIANRELAEAAGHDLEDLIKARDRAKALEAIQEGGSLVSRRLLEEGRLDGVIGLGGGTGTAMVSYIMRSLPFGLPKVIVSTVASRDVRNSLPPRTSSCSIPSRTFSASTNLFALSSVRPPTRYAA